jgi:hypothetical protein
VWDEADPAELQSIALEIAADLIGLYQSTDAGRDGPFHQLAGPFTSTRE